MTVFPVQPICEVLTEHGIAIAPRTYYAARKRAPSKRALSDLVLVEVLAGYYEPDSDNKRAPESLYGATKMWAHLNREGITVARCTVERLMRANGWQGVVRTKRVRTTEADPSAQRAPDLVDRDFGAEAPNQLAVGRFHLRTTCDRTLRVHSVRHRRLRRPDHRMGMFHE